MGSIGSMHLTVGANYSDFTKGMDKVESKARATKKTVDSLFSRGMAMPGKLAGGAQGLLGAVPFVGGSLATLAGAGGLLVGVREEMGRISEISKSSERLGVSSEFLTGLGVAAGGSTEAASAGLNHFERSLGEAAAGSKEAQAKFTRLGLSIEDVAGLKAMGAQQEFLKTADKLASMGSEVDRTRAFMDIFSRHAGGDLYSALLKGSAGIADATERAKLMGQAFSQLDAANVRKASLALRQIEGTVTGIFRQAAIGLAPYVEALAGGLNDLVKHAGGIGPFMKGIFEGIGDAIEWLLGKLDQLFNKLTDATDKKRQHLLLSFNSKDKLLSWEDDKAPEKSRLKDDFHEWREKAKNAVPERDGLDEGQSKIFEQTGKVMEFEEAIRKEIDTLGQGADAVKLWQLRHDGATDSMLAGTYKLLERKAALDALMKSFEHSGGILANAEREWMYKANLTLGLPATGSAAGIDAQVADLEKRRDLAKGAMSAANERSQLSGGEDIWADEEATRQAEILKDIEGRLKGIKDLRDQIAHGAELKLLAKGEEIKQRAGGPLGDFKSQLRDLYALRNGLDAVGNKKFDFGDKGFAAGIQQLMEANDKFGGGEVKLASGAEAGSTAAQSVISRAGVQTANDPVAKLQQLLQFFQGDSQRREQSLKAIELAVKDGRINFAPQGM